jgi:hypothetical protein
MEAAMRMLMNSLDPEVAEHPDQLIVYGGYGPRTWQAFDAIVTVASNGRSSSPDRPDLRASPGAHRKACDTHLTAVPARESRRIRHVP